MERCGANTASFVNLPGVGWWVFSIPCSYKSLPCTLQPLASGASSEALQGRHRKRTLPASVTAQVPGKNPIWKLEPRVRVPPPLLVKSGVTSFACQGPKVSIFSFVSHTVSTETLHLCCGPEAAATDNTAGFQQNTVRDAEMWISYSFHMPQSLLLWVGFCFFGFFCIFFKPF